MPLRPMRPDVAKIRRWIAGTLDASTPMGEVNGRSMTFMQGCKARLKQTSLTDPIAKGGRIVRNKVRSWDVPGIGVLRAYLSLDVTHVHVGLDNLAAAVSRLGRGAWSDAEVAMALEATIRGSLRPDAIELLAMQIERDLAATGERRLPFLLDCSVRGLQQLARGLSVTPA